MPACDALQWIDAEGFDSVLVLGDARPPVTHQQWLNHLMQCVQQGCCVGIHRFLSIAATGPENDLTRQQWTHP